MPKSVVIGANGFLGSSVVDALAGLGHEVTAFDRFSQGSHRFSADVPVRQGDFLDRHDIADAVRGNDYVFHFLSTTTPSTADSYPERDVRDNVAPSIALFEACVDAGVQHVYFASTGGAIYGDQSLE